MVEGPRSQIQLTRLDCQGLGKRRYSWYRALSSRYRIFRIHGWSYMLGSCIMIIHMKSTFSVQNWDRISTHFQLPLTYIAWKEILPASLHLNTSRYRNTDIDFLPLLLSCLVALLQIALAEFKLHWLDSNGNCGVEVKPLQLSRLSSDLIRGASAEIHNCYKARLRVGNFLAHLALCSSKTTEK